MKYHKIVKHYERCLEEFGPTTKGMDWPVEKDLLKRFKVMLGVISESKKKYKLLDLGCGAGLLKTYIKNSGRTGKIKYFGVDISEAMINAARKLNQSSDFEVRDVLLDPFPENSHDYAVMNGVLTEKVSLSKKDMILYAQKLIKNVFRSVKIGMAFNVMSTHVDWERKDLFHWSLDEIVAFLVRECSRHIIIRMDYGLYEYTVYVYKNSVYE